MKVDPEIKEEYKEGRPKKRCQDDEFKEDGPTKGCQASL